MQALFARVNQGPFNQGPFNQGQNGLNGFPIAIFVICLVVGLIIGLTIMIFYLLTLSKALSRCSARNRTMEPGMVWLNLIPCWNIVWGFITVLRVSESLDNEFYSRRLRKQGDFGKSIGLTYLICNLMGLIPYLGILASIVGFVCWIVYWMKIAGYSRQLLDSGGRHFDDEYDDEDGYDAPARRRKRSRYDDEEDPYADEDRDRY